MQSSKQSVLKAVFEHIKKDVTYPATKHDIMRTCNFREISNGERGWFDRTLPNLKFSSPKEVIKALIDKV